jgi:hypothetical protein
VLAAIQVADTFNHQLNDEKNGEKYGERSHGAALSLFPKVPVLYCCFSREFAQVRA